MGHLAGRVAIVTGAGNGIGEAVAKAMAKEGCAVVVNDLGVSVDGSGGGSAPSERVAEKIKRSGGRAVPNQCDVADFVSARELVGVAVREFGSLDIVVNVAGIVRDRMIFNMAEDEWDAVVRVHLKGTFNTSRHASAYWRDHRGGEFRLINFTSSSGLFGSPGQPNYAAAKMGIVGLTLSCANALKRYGVTANCISPTAATRMTTTIPDKLASAMRRPSMSEMAPEHVAPSVVYLASEDSGWLTGRVIGAKGNRITLYSNYEVSREVVSATRWDLEAVFREFDQTFRAAVEGRGRFDALI